jgi:hypothetical protein
MSDALKERLAAAIGLLDADLRASLARNVIDDMIGKNDAKYTGRILSLLDPLITLDMTTNKDQVARRIFSPIVSQPEMVSVVWMNEFLVSNPSFLNELPTGRKTELVERILNTLANEQLDEELTSELQKTKVLLGVAEEAKSVVDEKDESSPGR